jgi:hypothetical protein
MPNTILHASLLLAGTLLLGACDSTFDINVNEGQQDEAYSPLNDTGITACGDYASDGGSGTHNNDVDCASVGSTQTAAGSDGDGDPVPAGQDAVYGRDATHNDNSDGHAGFSFTKLDSNGDALADQSVSYVIEPWACVKDNVTGLIWEVKTDDGGLQDKGWRFTWYNSTGVNDGGDHGVGDTGVGTTTGLENTTDTYAGSDNCFDANRCDSEKYAADINAINTGVGLCGFNDWRLPTKAELNNIVSRDRVSPAIDATYFPNTLNSYYWSASPHASVSYRAWIVAFSYGNDSAIDKDSTYSVRLVRASN